MPSNDLVTYAHNAGLKALISVAEYDGAGFPSATGPTNRAVFINSLTNFMATQGYDGIDIDWEPLRTAEASQYTNFIEELRVALDAFNPPRLLTAATARQPEWLAIIQEDLDQINLMTHGLSGFSTVREPEIGRLKLPGIFLPA